ncbi:TPA: hypothetical protein JES96_001108 [Salmonella enterica subsp. enterica serovar Wangata]|nr:hypothetical protein [Salmonella enterica subsp. enterica serovar Wangata]
MDMPPECPPGFTVKDVFSIQVNHLIQNHVSEGYSCFIQIPDSLKGRDVEGYPYFDFEAARKQAEETKQELLQPVEISSGEFYLAVLLGGISFIAFAIGFAAGFIRLD